MASTALSEDVRFSTGGLLFLDHFRYAFHSFSSGSHGQKSATLQAIAANGLDGKALRRADADAMDADALNRVLGDAGVVHNCVGLPGLGPPCRFSCFNTPFIF